MRIPRPKRRKRPKLKSLTERDAQLALYGGPHRKVERVGLAPKVRA